ncbi:MAG TPA: hypothetical protein ENN81_10200 [Phycisphaerales bacterium]|nr:hypothetical protein [Phycisphaerales bacterium]
MFRRNQYHSVRRQTERAIRMAQAHGADVRNICHFSASSYFTVYTNDEVIEVRVSGHEPNYAATDDRDYMLYVGGPWCPSGDDTEAFREWCRFLQRKTGNPMPSRVKAFFTRRERRRL